MTTEYCFQMVMFIWVNILNIIGTFNSYFQPNGQGNYKFNANSKM